MTNLDLWSTRYNESKTALPGANIPWLAKQREQALERFLDIGWPTTKFENWRHTSLTPLARADFSQPSPGGRAEIAELKANYPGVWLVFVDGFFSAELSNTEGLNDKVTLEPLSETLKKNAEAVQPYLDVNAGESPAALNLALASDGAYLHVKANTAVETPINLAFVAQSANGASFPRSVVVLEPNAQAILVEHYIGQAGTSLTNTALTGSVQKDAHLAHYKVQQEAHEAYHLGACEIDQEEGSVYQSHSMSFGARLARHDIATTFNGRHCETLLNGLYYLDGRRHVDHHTQINHAKRDGVSHEYYRGILDDSSNGVFTGRIHVAEGADRTDAVQRSDSLLLSRRARATARPELEIYADDVKCAHGATVGQLDEDAMFYLRSRGLDKDHANAVLTYAFAATAVNRLTHKPVREQIELAIRKLMPAGQLLGETS